jgi:DNA-directed RNA polymerase specialized sigma24 family protein
MWQKYDQFKPGTNFAAWCVRIMRYQISEYRQNLARSKRVVINGSLFEALMDCMPAVQDQMAVLLRCIRKTPAPTCVSPAITAAYIAVESESRTFPRAWVSRKSPSRDDEMMCLEEA